MQLFPAIASKFENSPLILDAVLRIFRLDVLQHINFPFINDRDIIPESLAHWQTVSVHHLHYGIELIRKVQNKSVSHSLS